ncbi:MAG: hypothetical protein ACI4D4_10675 [Lachnospira sp.]
MKNIKRITSLFLAALLSITFIPVPASAAQDNTMKEEVVYINLNNDGSVKEINVVNIFELDENGTVIDYGSYENLRNMTTTDNIDYHNNRVSINADAGKLYYEGKLKGNDMPWNISIKYFMDGKEYSAKDIAGMSGKLEIKMSVRKNEKCDNSFFEGYALQTTFTLDTKKATDIKADGATQANVGSDKQLTYTILPNNEKDIYISANVQDFEMEGISINGIRMNLDVNIDDSSLQEKIDEVIGAVNEINDGASQLSNGLSSIISNNSQLTSGAWSAFEALCNAAQTQLNQQLTQNGYDSVALTPSTYSQVLMDLLVKMGAEAVYNTAYNAALAEVTLQVESQADTLYSGYIKSQEENIYLAYIESQKDLIYTQAASQAVVRSLVENYGYSEENAYAYLQTNEGQLMVANALAQMTEAQKSQIITTAVNSLTTEQKDLILQGAKDSLTTQQKAEIRNRYIEQIMSGEEVTSKINEAVKAANSAAADISALKGQLDNYKSFYNGLVDYTNAVSYAAEGASELTAGTGRFARETTDMESRMDSEINSMTTSITGSDVQTASFVSKENTNIKSVQFVIKTEKIKKTNVENVSHEEPKKLTFLQKLLRLFGLY